MFYLRNKKYTLRDVYQTQIEMLSSIITDSLLVKIVPLDEPLLNKRTLSEKYHAVEKTILHAYEYMDLFIKKSFSKNTQLIGVVQGYDKPSLQYSVYELKKMGYTSFAIGSLLNLPSYQQIEYIKFVADLVGACNLHVFGVTRLEAIKEMLKVKITSFDSSRPTMAAVYHQLFYSSPFRTYLVNNSKVEKTMPKLSKPLPCDCPVCQKNPNLLFQITHRKYTLLRSVHNYYHFNQTIESIKKSI